MKKTHYFLLAFFITLLYWVLDAYAHLLIAQSSWMQALLLQTPYSTPLMTSITAVLLFFATLIPLLLKQKPQKESADEFNALEKLSKLLFVSLATKFNVIKAQEKIEELLHLEGSLLFIYDKENFSLYNENEFIKSTFRSKDIFPFRTNHERSVVEEVAVRCFIEKTPFAKDAIKINKMPITLFSFLLKEEETQTIIGNLMLASNDPDFIEKHQPLIDKYILMLTFALSLAFKKEHLEKLNAQYSNESGSFDKILNVLNYEKIDEYLFYEFKRHKRYRTELTLMLIEINMFENLSKVFPQDSIITLKKEFIQLIHKYIREVDIFGKWSKDRFAILLPDSDFRAAMGLAKKLQGILETTKFSKVGKISCGYGITSLAPKDTLGSLKARAENAVVRASIHEGNAIEVKLQHGSLDDDSL